MSVSEENSSPADGLGNRRSIQLSYGAERRNREESGQNAPTRSQREPNGAALSSSPSNSEGAGKKPQDRRAANPEHLFLAAKLERHAVPEPNTGCHLWIGEVNEGNRGGYGILGRVGKRRIWAHRTAYELANGPIPEGLLVRHSCNTPACVNPRHLSVGTAKENAADMVRADRHPRGERSGLAKLTEAQALEIKRRRAAGERGSDLARAYGVSRTAVSLISNGRRWAHLSLAPRPESNFSVPAGHGGVR